MKDYKTRKLELRKILENKKLDLILIYSNALDSRYSRWIAGVYSDSFHYYFISNKDSGFFEISYLAPELRKQTEENVIEIQDNKVDEQFERLLKEYKVVGIVGEAPFIHLSKFKGKLVDVTEEVDKLLMVKSNREINKIKESAEILYDAFNFTEEKLKAGMSTLELSKLIKDRLLGEADELAFPISIATSEHLKESTIASPNTTIIKGNDIVCIDIGVIKNGFYSDATRMFMLKDGSFKKAYEKLCKINLEITRRIKEGTTLGEILKMYSYEFEQNGLPKNLEKQDLGHSIGFGLHEFPNFYSEDQKDFELKSGMVITLEPEITFMGTRLRVENMVRINEENSEIIL